MVAVAAGALQTRDRQKHALVGATDPGVPGEIDSIGGIAALCALQLAYCTSGQLQRL